MCLETCGGKRVASENPSAPALRRRASLCLCCPLVPASRPSPAKGPAEGFWPPRRPPSSTLLRHPLTATPPNLGRDGWEGGPDLVYLGSGRSFGDLPPTTPSI